MGIDRNDRGPLTGDTDRTNIVGRWCSCIGQRLTTGRQGCGPDELGILLGEPTTADDCRDAGEPRSEHAAIEGDHRCLARCAAEVDRQRVHWTAYRSR